MSGDHKRCDVCGGIYAGPYCGDPACMKAPRDAGGKPLPPPAKPGDVVCFWIEPHDSIEIALRRYVSRSKCSKRVGIHDASVTIEIAHLPATGLYGGSRPPTDSEKEDPRWPTHCECGFGFLPDDAWQWNERRRFTRPDTGEIFTHDAAPPGAMWDATWRPADKPTPDGKTLVVRLPDGVDWMIDGRANNGPGWTRTGTPPKITARPSILTSGYHGWLTDGVLKSC